MFNPVEMRELVNLLNDYTEKYDIGQPVVSDAEWDVLYRKLQAMESDSGVTYPDSPAASINYKPLDGLKKVKHNHPLLSLDKTKDIKDVHSLINNRRWIAMCKMDGLTCSLTYKNGVLISAETRGNGIEGEDITNNAFMVSNIPKSIEYKDDLTVDGEIICTYENFEEFKDEYKNPRNFAAGSIRLLDAKECGKRKLSFIAWDCLEPIGNFLSEKLDILNQWGFDRVPFNAGYKAYDDERDLFNETIINLKSIANMLKFPIDGIVFKLNVLKEYYAEGQTDHHFKGGIAYKFYDDEYDSELIDIEWQVGRTGVLTPVAIFEPIEIDGTEVSRASLHNLSIIEEVLHRPYIGQKIKVIKSNQIIPQITWGEEIESYNRDIFINRPDKCPCCGDLLLVEDNHGVKTLNCVNPSCGGVSLNRLIHFCSKKGLDIKGLSEATLSKLMDYGWVEDINDIFTLSLHRNEWIKKEGFGVASVDKILQAIETAKECTLDQFIASLGIPLIGNSVAKELMKYVDSYEDFRSLVNIQYAFSKLPTFGYEKEQSLLNFDYSIADEVYKYMKIKTEDKIEQSSDLKDYIICITGKLKTFKNRDELKTAIEARGGKVTDSVSKNTSLLINNDTESTSAKNKKAKELNIPIITEENFKEKFLTN